MHPENGPVYIVGKKTKMRFILDFFLPFFQSLNKHNGNICVKDFSDAMLIGLHD